MFMKHTETGFVSISFPFESYRSLQVFAQHDTTHAALLTAQRAANSGSGLGGPLRYHDVVLFWLQCEKTGMHSALVELSTIF